MPCAACTSPRPTHAPAQATGAAEGVPGAQEGPGWRAGSKSVLSWLRSRFFHELTGLALPAHAGDMRPPTSRPCSHNVPHTPFAWAACELVPSAPPPPSPPLPPATALALIWRRRNPLRQHAAGAQQPDDDGDGRDHGRRRVPRATLPTIARVVTGEGLLLPGRRGGGEGRRGVGEAWGRQPVGG